MRFILCVYYCIYFHFHVLWQLRLHTYICWWFYARSLRNCHFAAERTNLSSNILPSRVRTKKKVTIIHHQSSNRHSRRNATAENFPFALFVSEMAECASWWKLIAFLSMTNYNVESLQIFFHCSTQYRIAIQSMSSE